MRVFFAVIALAVIALFITGVFLFAPNWLPEYLRYDLDLRVSIAQLPIAVASMIALFLAAWEFRQTQKKPKLRLALRVYLEDSLFFGGVYPEPLNLSSAYDFIYMGFYLDNIGEAAARFIKVSILSDDLKQWVKFDNIAASPARAYSGWKKELNRLDFNGGEDCIIYSHPQKVSELKNWVDKIGEWKMSAPNLDENSDAEQVIKLICYLEAYDFPRTEQTFSFRVKIRKIRHHNASGEPVLGHEV